MNKTPVTTSPPDAEKSKNKGGGRTFGCHARRHMTASLYMTYDAILAMAKSGQDTSDAPLLFYGRISTLANHTGRSRQTESDNISRLVELGWLSRFDDEQPKQEDSGRWRPQMYEVFDHDEIAKAKRDRQLPICKPFRYDPETGERTLRRGTLKAGLQKYVDKQRQSQP